MDRSRPGSAETSPRLESKVFLNEYGFRMCGVRLISGHKLLWECLDEDLIAKSSEKEVEMNVQVYLT